MKISRKTAVFLMLLACVLSASLSYVITEYQIQQTESRCLAASKSICGWCKHER
jgi:Na+-translocating ferredoxin:NAD+ oxidoreductase RnfG subunit